MFSLILETTKKSILLTFNFIVWVILSVHTKYIDEVERLYFSDDNIYENNNCKNK